MSPSVKVGVSVVVVLGALGFLLSQSVGEQMVYSKYVDELLNQRAKWTDRTVRVEGLVEEGSVQNRPGTLDYRFRLTKGGKSLPVRYQGIMPDTFRENVGAVAQGRLTAQGVFVADQVMAKCPSKYEMQAKSSAGTVAPHSP